MAVLKQRKVTSLLLSNLFMCLSLGVIPNTF